MKLLVIYPYLPWPLDRGTHHRTFHLLKELAAVDEVHLLALAEKGEGTEHKHIFEQFCRSVTVLSFEHPGWQKLFPGRLLNKLPASISHWTLPHLAREIDRMLGQDCYDAVHVCDIVMAQYFLDEHREIPLVVDRSRVDLQYQWMEYQRMNRSFRQRLLSWESFIKLSAYERKVARRTALQIVCGPDDETFVRKFISRTAKVAVLVNGVDIDFFRAETAVEPRTSEPSILFCGAMDYNPNIDALRWYFSEIHNGLKREVPELHVYVVGKSPIAEVQNYGTLAGVTVTGSVPDVRPFYRRAWLQIVPLRIGGGTRLKIVESMAIGTPVVSTTIGAQGLDLLHDQEILLADDASAFIRETARALKDASLRNRLEEQGMHTVRSRLAWPMIGKRLIAAYAKLFPTKSLPPKPVATT